MGDKISREVRKKGYLLFREGKVKKELETDKRVHFKVFGETDTYSVIFDKERNEFSCDCRFSTLKQKICSHVIASEILLKEKLKR
ncbi:MAG: hypothetical protein QMD12_02850 [Candidatus Aenigmarchaeota archaeon]|nr:hypothetical protein [Candidatus Aenigmarchaeota archaeon]